MKKIIFLSCMIILIGCQRTSTDDSARVIDSSEIGGFDKTPNDTVGFQYFISLFKKTNQEIPDSIRIKFLNLNWSREYGYSNCVADSILFQQNNIMGVIYIFDCGAGGICSMSFLKTFSSAGIVIDSLKVAYHIAELRNDDEMTYKFIPDSTIITYSTRKKYDVDTEELISERNDSTQYIISKSGKIKYGS